MDVLWESETQKSLDKARWNQPITAKYSLCQGYGLYLVRSKRCCVLWVVEIWYYPSDIITGDVYRRQLMRLKGAIKEKQPEWVNRHSKLIFQYDNARPLTPKVVKTYLNGQDWEVLLHLPYSPDIAPSDYHLFQTMQSDLTGEWFTSYESIIIWLDSWIVSKDQDFFRQEIRKLPERWTKVVAADGAYFD